jgi:glycosyltransferase involved in cell wall biosynthesis
MDPTKGNVLINPRGLDHLGGVGLWGKHVASNLVQNYDYVVAKQKYTSSSNHQITRASEFFLLPRESKKYNFLLSLCNWGPLVSNQVIVIHDIAPLIHPEFFSKSYALFCEKMIPKLVTNSSKICTVSDFSADEISRYLQIPRNEITTLGAAPTLNLEQEEFLQINYRYMLFVGAHDTRKNLEFLLRFWPIIYGKTNLKLLVTGQVTPKAFRKKKQSEYCKGINYLGYVNSGVLTNLIRNADAILTPSIYEGFNLPVIESLSLGTQVISSPTGVATTLKNDGLTVLDLEPVKWVNKILDQSKINFSYQAESWSDIADKVNLTIKSLN